MEEKKGKGRSGGFKAADIGSISHNSGSNTIKTRNVKTSGGSPFKNDRGNGKGK